MNDSEIQVKAQVFIIDNKLFKFIKILLVVLLMLLEYRQTKKKIIF